MSRIPKATYYKLREIPLSVLVIINVSLEELEAFVFATFSRQSRMRLLTEWGIPENFLERPPKVPGKVWGLL
ncbi:MAG: hypothetical protein AB9861_21165 [Methanosarcina sp.]